MQRSAFPSPASPASTWTNTGSLHTERYDYTATLLQNGKVLVAGGQNARVINTLARSEVYDPTTGMWAAAGSLRTSRVHHTATLLRNSTVLVAGGSHAANDGTMPFSLAASWPVSAGCL